MSDIVKVVGTIELGERKLDVYSSLDKPVFKASDIADMLDYSAGNVWNLLGMCEEDEKLLLTMIVAGQRRQVSFVTEHGLYNIFEQSRKPLARRWRRLINNKLIEMRKARNLDILEQFQEWDHELDNIYFDEETGMIMESVTVQGGDVEQVPYRGELV